MRAAARRRRGAAHRRERRPLQADVGAHHGEPHGLGNAERFEAFAGDRFRFVHNWGSWLWFDGTRWQRDVDGEAVRAGRDTLRATAAEAGTVPDPDDRDQLAKHALDAESSARIAAMLSLAQLLLPVSPEALDADPDLFNCANGTIDLLTRRSPVLFDPG